MTNEEKHENDLEAAKGWYTIAKEHNNKLGVQILENLFPELKESEDEKIRKDIIQILANTDLSSVNTTFADMLSWLEKQKDIIEKYEDKLDRCACESWDKGYKEGKNDCEWSEEDEKCFIELDTIIYQNSSLEDYYRLYDWLKSLKDRVQPKQEWLEPCK